MKGTGRTANPLHRAPARGRGVPMKYAERTANPLPRTPALCRASPMKGAGRTASQLQSWLRWLSCGAVLLALDVSAASRAKYGGIVRVAVSGAPSELDPALADMPLEASVLQLSSQPICHFDKQGRVTSTMALELSRPTPTQVRIALKSGLRFSGGGAVTVRHVADAWSRLLSPATPSPYRALFFPLREHGRQLLSAVTPPSLLELSLAFPWPDLDRSLCHPALAITPNRTAPGMGPFLPASAPGVFIFNLNFPAGRPFAERVVLTNTDERGADKQYSLGQANVILGGEATKESRTGPALYATYLLFKPEAVGPNFRGSFEVAIDRADLVRNFTQSAPSVAMQQLLPPALMPQQPARQTGVAGSGPATELTLMFDLGAPDQRAVAERIQVKLHDRGFRIVLRGVSRTQLRAKWASGEYDLMLHGVLLPPSPGPALAVALDLAGRRDLLATELPAIGAIADSAARDARVRERAEALLPQLSIYPLYAQGLALRSRAEVLNLYFDPQGLPQLADAFLSPGAAP